MTYIQTFVILSTVLFGCALMSVFGVVMSLSSLGLVLANGVKLV